MGQANRVVGYLASAVAASLFYVAWFALTTAQPSGGVGILFDIAISLFLWSFEGMAAALLLMALPWF